MGRACFFSGNRNFRKQKTMPWRGRKKLKVARNSAQLRQRSDLDTLRGIIPGCEQVDAATLFLKTMEHIIKLELQLHILRSLTNP